MITSHFPDPNEQPHQYPRDRPILQQPKDVGNMILPILQMGKLRLHERKWDSQGCLGLGKFNYYAGLLSSFIIPEG